MRECISIKTDYSLLSSVIKIPDLILYAKNNNISTLGIVDDNLSSSIEFINECIKNSIKPVIGLDVLINSKRIYLYARNNEGINSLIKISNYIIDNMLTIDILDKYKNNLIVVIPYSSIEVFDLFKEKFLVFLGYSNNKEYEEVVKKHDRIIFFNIVLSLSKANTKYINYLYMIKNNLNYNTYDNVDYSSNYIMLEDVSSLTSLININTIKLANQIPHYDEKISDSYKYLEALSLKGLSKRLSGNVTDIYKERLLYELSVIKEMDFVDYFLIVYDYVKYAINNNIYVGPGRGSAVGSLVTYSLGITSVDPIKYGLLFERFLNKGRITMPDIDIDFDASKREEVINYVKDRYGSDRVYPIVTYGTFAPKQALLSVASLLDVDINSLSKKIDSSIPLEKNLNKEVLDILNKDSNIKRVFYDAMQIEGIKKHISTHAAGIVISKDSLNDIVPVIKSGNNYLVGYTKDYLEQLGLLKMDFLSSDNLTIITNTINMLNIPINMNQINLNDSNVYKEFSLGNTDNIFQFSSLGMKKFLKLLKPVCFDDLVCAIALYRPGTMQNIETFINRRNGKEKIKYVHPSLESILKDTYGVIVYQEQIMEIFRKVSLYSFSEADLIRRAISKKKEDIVIKEKDKFIKKAINNGYLEEEAINIFNFVLQSCSYTFNKSHSVGYALVSYQMMYLRVNYKIYYYTALLNMAKSNVNKIKMLFSEIKNNEIEIAKPSINKSNDYYTIIDNRIVMPFSSINGLNSNNVNMILLERKDGYKDIFDFISRININNFGLNSFESLVYSGVFNEFGISIRTLIENMKSIIRYSELSMNMDDVTKKLVTKPMLTAYEEYNSYELVNIENKCFGFYISDHPAKKFGNVLKHKNVNRFVNQKVNTVGVVEKIKSVKNGTMAFLTISDETGDLSYIVFSSNMVKVQNINVGDLVKIFGKIEHRNDEYQIVIIDIKKI